MTDDFVDSDPDLFDPVVAARVEDAAYDKAKDADAAVAAHLRRSQSAYRAVFVAGNATPGDVDFVMRDLMWFAKVDQHFFNDTRLQDVYIGRKQVIQRIVEYTRFDHDTLVKRYVEAQQ